MANERARGLGYKFVTDDKYLVDPFSPTDGISYEGDGSPVSYANSGIMAQAPAPLKYIPQGEGGGNDDDDDDGTTTTGTGKIGKIGLGTLAKTFGYMTNPLGMLIGKGIGSIVSNIKDPYKSWYGGLNTATKDAIGRDNDTFDNVGQATGPGPESGKSGAHDGPSGVGGGYNEGNACFEPNTLIKMADDTEKKIKYIKLGDNTKGGEVTGVFQFKASDEIHNYKGVIVAGSHFVKEDDKFIMVKDSPLAIKIDKIPVVYSLDTTGRRIFIKDIEFADYNGDGVAKSFLSNAGADLTGFDKEVLRQVENRLI